MIALGDARSAPPTAALLRARGGFLWWYLDVIDPQGNGLVAIWSAGLPFLPGYASAARAGSPPAAEDRPSLNLAWYREGQLAFYLLQEHPPGSLTVDGESFRLGDSTLTSRVVGDRRQLVANVDTIIPEHGRVTASLALEGPLARITHVDPSLAAIADGTASDHRWTPLATATAAEARLEVGGVPFGQITGRGYHDRNGSPAPLHDLGIQHWVWGRVPDEQAEWIWYLVWPESGAAPTAMVLRVGVDGATAVHAAEVAPSRWRMGRWGLPYARGLALRGTGFAFDVDLGAPVEDGPFYLRFQPTARFGDRVVRGWGEVVRPARVDRWWHRHFVAMAVHRVAGPNAAMLPWFCGPQVSVAARIRAGELPPPMRRAALGSAR